MLAFILAIFTASIPSPLAIVKSDVLTPVQFVQNGEASVIGSGPTYKIAYEDALARLPQGAQMTTVRSRESGNVWYVTIFYNRAGFQVSRRV